MPLCACVVLVHLVLLGFTCILDCCLNKGLGLKYIGSVLLSNFSFFLWDGG